MEYTGAVFDALKLCGVDARKYYIDLKPTAGYKPKLRELISGPVFTTKGRTVAKWEDYDELDSIRYEIYEKFADHFKQHRPIVALQANDKKVAHTGDITSDIYKRMGSAGFFSDGKTRDVTLIDEIGYPVFTDGATPIDALDYWAIVDYDCEIEIQGVKIRPMDWAFMDADGIMIVPQELLKEFAGHVEAVYEKEDAVRMALEKNFDARKLKDQFGRW